MYQNMTIFDSDDHGSILVLHAGLRESRACDERRNSAISV